VRGAGGGASATDYGAAISAATAQTFSNAAASVAVTAVSVFQTGTMAAARTLTLPAASDVVAGREIFVADKSNTVTSANRITMGLTGADTFVAGPYPHITTPGGWRKFMSDGVSAWIVSGSSHPHLLWEASAATDYSTESNDASAVIASSWGSAPTLAGNLGGSAYLFTTTGGAATRYSARILDGATGPTIPANKRFTLSFEIGPRVTSALGAYVGVGQGVTRMLAIYRSATQANLDANLRNDTTTASATAHQVVVGAGTNDVGGYAELDVEIVDPVTSTSQPDLIYVLKSDAGGIGRTQVAALSGNNWRDSGPLKVIVGGFEIGASAGTSFVKNLRMWRHPRDR
jgi:hypothetical protein